MAKSSSTSNKLLISPLVNVDKKKVPVQDEQTAAEEVAAPPKTRARGKVRVRGGREQRKRPAPFSPK